MALIVKIDGLYLIWSKVSDSPESYGMTLDELKAMTLDKEGTRGLEMLETRLVRVEAKGTSAHNDADADDTMWLNAAATWLKGWKRPDLRPLSKAEIIEWYVRRKQTPTMAQIRAHRRTLPKCDPCVADDGKGGGHLCPCWGSGVREESKPAPPAG